MLQKNIFAAGVSTLTTTHRMLTFQGLEREKARMMDRQARIRENLQNFTRAQVSEANAPQPFPRAGTLLKGDGIKPVVYALPKAERPARPRRRWFTRRTLRIISGAAMVLGYIGVTAVAMMAASIFALHVCGVIPYGAYSEDLIKATLEELFTIGTRCVELSMIGTLVYLRFRFAAWVMIFFEAFKPVVAALVGTIIFAIPIILMAEVRLEVAAIIGVPLFCIIVMESAEMIAKSFRKMKGDYDIEPDADFDNPPGNNWNGSPAPAAPVNRNIQLT